METSKKKKKIKKNKQNETKTEELAVVERTDTAGRQEKEINRKKVEKARKIMEEEKRGNKIMKLRNTLSLNPF